MRARVFAVGFVVAVGLLAHPLVGGEIQTELVAIEDVLLDSTRANKNTEGELSLPIRSDAAEARALFRFDPSSLEVHAEGEVVSATLRLHVEELSGFAQFLRAAMRSDRTGGAAIVAPSDLVSVHRLTQDWSVTGATWSCPVDSALQNNKADCAAPWDGGTFEAATDDLALLDNTIQTVDLEVGADLQAFLEGTPNFGWLVQAPLANLGAGLLQVTSTEGPAAQAPRLLVTFDTDAVAPGIEFVDPAPPNLILLKDPRPPVEIRFTDGGSGLDLGSVAVLLDAADISSQCSVTGDTADATAICTLTSDLTEGLHTLQATVLDADGNQTTASREMDLLLGPGPHTREIIADADATLRSGAPSQNFGTDPTLTVQDAPTARSVLHFDVSAYELLPLLTDTVFEDVELRVFAETAVQLGAGRSVDAARSRDLIIEDEITWECRSDEDPAVAGVSCSLPWNGGAFESPPADTVGVTDATTGWLTWNLPVSSLEETPSTPFSSFLRFSDDGDTTVSADPPAVTFTSREGIPGQQPRVRLTFRTPLVGDETPPEVVFTAPLGRTLDSTPAVVLTFSDDQAGVDPTTFQLTLASLFLDITANCTVTASGADCLSPALFDGVHTFIATLADLAGNSSQTIHRVTIGPGPPDIEILSPGLSVLNDATPQIEAAFSDLDGDFDPATVRVLVDGLHITSSCIIDLTSALCASPLLAEGSHRLLVIAGDLAGFEVSAERVFDVTFDATFPDLAITAPTTHFVLDQRPNITVTYSGTGVDPGTFVLLLDGTDITSTCSVGALQADCEPAAFLGEGEHELRASVANASGNSRTVVRGFDLLPGDGGYVRTLTAVEDTSIGAGGGGNATFLAVQASPDLPTRTLVRFDTSIFDSLAARATLEVEDLVLSLTVVDHIDFNPNGMTLDLFPLTQGWDETEATRQCPADEDPATPGTQCAVSWSGGTLGPLVTSDVVTIFDGQAVFDVVGNGGGLEPFGWALLANPEIDDGQGAPLPTVHFASREHGVLLPPELGVSFFVSNVPDFVPPSLVILSPDALVVNNSTPDVEISHSDSQSGVDLTTLAVTVDGVDISAECGLSSPSESTCSLLFALDAGFHTVQAQVADSAGNVATAERVFEVIFDTLPPTINRLSPPATIFNDTQPLIEVTYSDDDAVDTSTLEIGLDSVDLLPSCVIAATDATCTPPTLAAGSHTLRLYIEDRSRHSAEEDFVFEIILDTTAPTLAITAPAGTVYNDTTPAVTVTFSDDNAGVDAASLDVQMDGVSIVGSCAVDEVAGTATCEPAALTAGTHTVAASLADLAGNPASASASFDLVIDTVAPTLAITTPTGTVVGDTTPAITVTFSDAGSGLDTATLAVRVNGFDITASCGPGIGTTTCEPPELSDGSHTVTAEIADLAGNRATASNAFTLDLGLVDTMPPSLDIAAPAGAVVDDPAPAINVIYSDAETSVDVTKLQVTVDGFDISDTCTIGAAPGAICFPPLLGAGTHTIAAQIVDLAGNLATATATFDLSFTTTDAVAPVVAIAEPADTVVFDDLTPQITVSYSDADSGVAILTLAVDVDGTDITAGCALGDAAAVCEPLPLTVGTHVVTATVQDLHGNVGSGSFGFDIALTTPDTTAPTIAIAEPATTPVDTDVVPIRVTYSDGETGVHLSSLVITLDTTDITATCDVGPTEATCTSPVLTEGLHTLDASIQDLAGNPASASFGFEVVLGAVDLVPPSIAITQPVDDLIQGVSSPPIEVTYSDAESGLDLTSLKILVDSLELTSTCTVGAAAATCIPPAMGDGFHTIRAEVRDRDANLGRATKTIEIVLAVSDQTPPVLEILAPAEGALPVGETTPTLSIQYSDGESQIDLSSLRVLLSGSDLTSLCQVSAASALCEPPPLFEGDHRMEVEVRDLAGNSAEAARSFEVILGVVDTVPPTVAITSPLEGATLSDRTPEILVTYSDSETGVPPAAVEVLLDGADLNPRCVIGSTTATCEPSPLSDGTHTVRALVGDLALNPGFASSTFTIVSSTPDTVNPTITITSLSEGMVTSDPSPQVSINYSDAGAGLDFSRFRWFLDGLPFTERCVVGLSAATCGLPILTEGSHTVVAAIEDLVGNVAADVVTFELQLSSPDTTPPTLSILRPNDALIIGDRTPSVTLEFADDVSGVDLSSLDVFADEVRLTLACEISATVAECETHRLDEGMHQITATLADMAGNPATATFEFKLLLRPPDTVPPQLQIVSPAGSSFAEGVGLEIGLVYDDADSGVVPPTLQVLVDTVDVTVSCSIAARAATCPMPSLALGLHQLDARIEDQDGNETSATHSFALTPETLPPRVSIVSPGFLEVVRDASPEIVLEFSDRVSGVDPASLVVEMDGVAMTASCVVDVSSATCESPELTAGRHEVVARVADVRGNVGSTRQIFEVSLKLDLTILSPSNGLLTSEPSVDVSGTVAVEAESVQVGGVDATVQAGSFTAAGVPLREGANTLTVVARNSGGGIGSATVNVVRDTAPPTVVLQSPPDGFVTTSPQILLTGEYNEPISSAVEFREATVVANGIPAQVENRTFFIDDFLLQPGENLIRVEVTDQAGNTGMDELRVTLLADLSQKIEELLGNGQSGTVGETLAEPLIVRLTDVVGNPLPNRRVQFAVTRGAGTVITSDRQDREVTVVTDERGLAEANFRLGDRAGVGNQEVTATAAGFPGAVIFCASANPRPAERIVRIVGNDHSGALAGAVNEEYPKPLRTKVFDEFGNPVAAVSVTYEVVTGNGSFEGQPSSVVVTDETGVAAAMFTLGPLAGIDINVIKATIPEGTGGPAVFNITGLEPGPEGLTAISGVVLDNQDLPVPGVTVSLADTALSTVTDAEGRFHIAGVPVGTVHLVADGTTTTLAGTWPVLAFEMVTVSGQDNELGMPIRLLPIDPGALVGGSSDVVIPLEGVPGATLTVFADSVTFPDGSNEGLVSFTQVHADKVPMVPPLGSSFALAVTIQPPGVHFDPPARLQFPNPGHPPGTVMDLFSFDHDLGEFVTAGLATVTSDGRFVVSNPGFGVRKAGWHGPTLPVPTTNACNPGTCSICSPSGPAPRCAVCEVCSPTSGALTFSGDGDLRLRAEAGILPCIPELVSSVEITASVELDGQRRKSQQELVVGVDQEVDFLTDVSSTCFLDVFQWDFQDGGQGFGATTSHVFEETGLFTVTVDNWCACAANPAVDKKTDTIQIRVVDANLKVDSDNNGIVDDTDDEIETESPGALVIFNGDDDNDNDTPDHEEETMVEGEDDLLPVDLVIDQQANLTGFKIELRPGGEVNLWEGPTKDKKLEVDRILTIGTDSIPMTLWAEAVNTGETTVAVRLLDEEEQLITEDSVTLTAFRVEIEEINFRGAGNVDIRIDGLVDIGDPGGGTEDIEWIREQRDGENSSKPWDSSQSAPAAYLKSQPLEIGLKVSVEPESVLSSAAISATNPGDYGDLSAVTVSFSGTEGSADISGSSADAPGTVDVNELELEWTLESVQVAAQTVSLSQTIATTHHRIYTLLDTPLDPMDEPWATVLELSTALARDKNAELEILERVTSGIHHSFWKGFTESKFIKPVAKLEYEPNAARSDYNSGPSSQKYDLINFLAFLQSESIVQQCNDNANLLTAVFARSLGIAMNGLWFTTQQLPGSSTPVPVLAPTTYYPAGRTIKETHDFTFHQIGKYNELVFDPSTRPHLEGPPFVSTSFSSYISQAFPAQPFDLIVPIDVAVVTIGPVLTSPFKVTAVSTKVGNVGETTPVTLDGAGFTSDIGVSVAKRDSEHRLIGVPGVFAQNLTILSFSRLTVDVVAEPTVPPGSYELIVVRQGLDRSAVLVHSSNFILESP